MGVNRSIRLKDRLGVRVADPLPVVVVFDRGAVTRGTDRHAHAVPTVSVGDGQQVANNLAEAMAVCGGDGGLEMLFERSVLFDRQ